MKHQQFAYVGWNWQTLETLISEADHGLTSFMDALSLKSLNVLCLSVNMPQVINGLCMTNVLLAMQHSNVEQ